MRKSEHTMFRIPLFLIIILIGYSSPMNASIEGGSIEPSSVENEHMTLADKKALAESLEINGEHEDAVRLLYRVIEEIERQQGPYHPDLSPPLLSLANNLLALGLVKEAESAFRKGQHITHRSKGVLSLDQLAFLEGLTKSFLVMERPLDANTQQEFIFYIHERNHQQNILDLLPALEKLSRWYLETGQFTRSQKVLKRAVSMIAEHSGETSLDMNESLYLLSKSERLKSRSSCCGEEMLQKIVAIVENNPGATDEDRRRVYLELADALIAKRRPRLADVYYRKAWNLSTEDGKSSDIFTRPVPLIMISQLDNSGIKRYQTPGGALPAFAQSPLPLGRTSLIDTRLKQYGYAEATLDIPPQVVRVTDSDNDYNVLINVTHPRQYQGEKSVRLVGDPFQFILRQLQYILPPRLRDPSRLADLEINISFSVTADGIVRNIELLDSNGPVKLNRLVMLATRKSKFRPAIIEGDRVKTDQVTLTQTFK